MGTLVTPTTELEAVNECLANIGQSPVSTISGDIGVDAEQALALVRSVTRELLSKGWYWNTDKEYKLSPNVDGDIILSDNVLWIDTSGRDADKQYVLRGRMLYDRVNHTYNFTDDVYVDRVMGLSFDEIPESGRRYIALRSARIFQERIEGTSDQSDISLETEAMNELISDHLRVEDNNILTDNYQTWNMLRRFPTY